VRSTMLLTYNIQPQAQEAYMQFMINVFMPMAQSLGLDNAGVWHTAYGDYPARLLVFVAEESVMQNVLKDERWQNIEARLKEYTTDYTRRIVPYVPGFQF